MKNNNGKINLTTIFLIFAFILIIIMGVMIFSLNNKLNSKSTQSTYSNNHVSDLNLNSNSTEVSNITDTSSNPNSSEEQINNKTSQSTNSEINISFKEETYTTKNTSGEISTSNKRNLPTITYSKNQGIANSIVNNLTEISDNEWAKIKESADIYKDCPYLVGVNYLMSLVYQTDNIVTFEFKESGDFGGSGWTNEELYSYDLTTGKLLDISSITKDSNSVSKIKNLVIEEIKSNYNTSDLFSNWEEIINKDFKTTSVGYTKNGLEFNFKKYSLSSGSLGLIAVCIDYNELNDYITK